MMCGVSWPGRGLFRRTQGLDVEPQLDPSAARISHVRNNCFKEQDGFKERSEDDVSRLLKRNNSEARNFDVLRPWTTPLHRDFRADGEKIFTSLQDSVAIYSAKGHRRSEMQDAFCVSILPIHLHGTIYSVPCFSIFDGHGGSNVAAYLADHLHEELLAAIYAYCQDGFTDRRLWYAFKQACLTINTKICERFIAGSTAIVCLIIQDVLWTLNVGDSRAILAEGAHFVGLSRDQQLSHCTSIAAKQLKKLQKATKRPENATGAERDFMRIAKRGGKIIKGYIRGDANSYEYGINLPRSFGDRLLAVEATRVISAKPEITRCSLAHSPSQILVLGCDGVWDRIGSGQAAEQIQRIQASEPSLVETCLTFGRQIANHPRQNDNVTIMMVQLGSFTQQGPSQDFQTV